jgi:hypothetical protein
MKDFVRARSQAPRSLPNSLISILQEAYLGKACFPPAVWGEATSEDRSTPVKTGNFLRRNNNRLTLYALGLHLFLQSIYLFRTPNVINER